MADQIQTPVSKLVAGAGNAAAATAVTNFNTAMAAAVAAALTATAPVVGTSPNNQSTIKTGCATLIFDGTLYVASGCISYIQSVQAS